MGPGVLVVSALLVALYARQAAAATPTPPMVTGSGDDSIVKPHVPGGIAVGEPHPGTVKGDDVMVETDSPSNPLGGAVDLSSSEGGLGPATGGETTTEEGGGILPGTDGGASTGTAGEGTVKPGSEDTGGIVPPHMGGSPVPTKGTTETISIYSPYPGTTGSQTTSYFGSGLAGMGGQYW